MMTRKADFNPRSDFHNWTVADLLTDACALGIPARGELRPRAELSRDFELEVVVEDAHGTVYRATRSFTKGALISEVLRHRERMVRRLREMEND